MSVPPIDAGATARHCGPKRASRGLAAGALAVLVAACVSYRPAPIQPRRSAAAFAARRLDDPYIRAAVARLLPARAAPWPPDDWNRGMLLAVAWADNPTLAVARAEVRAAIARQRTAAQMRNPDLRLMSEYARHDAHPWLYGLETAWLIRWSGRRRLAMRIAWLRSSDAQLGLMDRLWAVRRELIASLADWQGARRRVVVLDRLAAAQNRLIRYAHRRVVSGEDPSAVLFAAETQGIDVQQQRSAALATAEAGLADAARTLGLPRKALAGAKILWRGWGRPPRIKPAVLRTARERALLSRADLGAAIGEYAVAEARLQRAVARQYPQLVLGPGYYWDHGIAKLPFDVGFTLPLNGYRGEIAEARAARTVAGRRMLALQADIYGRIAAAVRTEQLARAAVAVAGRRLDVARRQAARADLAARLGEVNGERRLASAVIVAQAELALLQMRSRLQAARDALEDALHAPLSGPELALIGPRAFARSAAGT
ncbi:MAG TPA: TolC family protein [Steroidobacteraceae bacterium]|nr:TolC family protein [Steroidobacteraceae bacterium]HVC02670.1 TolC family protein [Steroidobacteraceae bacterium]